MGWGGISSWWGGKPNYVERDSSGNWLNVVFSSFGLRKIRLTEREKLNIVLTNAAVLKVVALNCDLFSLGKINQYSDGKIKKEDFLYSVAQRPNFKQSWSQFMWDYMFWISTNGTAYLYNPLNAKVLKDTNPIQWLNPCYINWNAGAVQKMMAFIFTKQSWNEVMSGEISYTLGSGQVQMMRLIEVTPFFDLTNSAIDDGNYYKGASRLDALYKIVANSEMALDAKLINLEMAQKFMVSGQTDPSNVTQIPMSDPEKRSIEEVVRSFKNVHAVKNKITVERFVENIAQLKLDESFNDDMIKIASVMNVPTEVLDINSKDSTYENQEKATGRQIEYCLKPKGKPLTDWFEYQYGFKDIRIGWESLSFNQVFEKERAEKDKIKSETLLNLMKAGVLIDTINEMLGTQFKELDYDAAQRQNTTTQGQSQQGN